MKVGVWGGGGGGPLRKREKGFLGFAIKTIFFFLFFGSTCIFTFENG
jgi:hypothetical protein